MYGFVSARKAACSLLPVYITQRKTDNDQHNTGPSLSSDLEIASHTAGTGSSSPRPQPSGGGGVGTDGTKMSSIEPDSTSADDTAKFARRRRFL